MNFSRSKILKIELHLKVYFLTYSNDKVMKQTIAILWLAMLTSSCAVRTAAADNNSFTSEEEKSNILFVVFKIKKGTTKSTIEIVSTTISEGKLKKQPEDTLDSNQFVEIEVTSGNNAFQLVKINHPLYKDIEYSNSNGELKKKRVEVNEDTFFVRFQLKGAAATLRIKEKLENSMTNEIATFKL